MDDLVARSQIGGDCCNIDANVFLARYSNWVSSVSLLDEGVLEREVISRSSSNAGLGTESLDLVDEECPSRVLIPDDCGSSLIESPDSDRSSGRARRGPRGGIGADGAAC